MVFRSKSKPASPYYHSEPIPVLKKEQSLRSEPSADSSSAALPGMTDSSDSGKSFTKSMHVQMPHRLSNPHHDMSHLLEMHHSEFQSIKNSPLASQAKKLRELEHRLQEDKTPYLNFNEPGLEDHLTEMLQENHGALNHLSFWKRRSAEQIKVFKKILPEISKNGRSKQEKQKLKAVITQLIEDYLS